MRVGDTVYFIVSGRRIQEATVKRIDGNGVLAAIQGGALRLSRSRFYPTQEAAEKHLLPPVPKQRQDDVYTRAIGSAIGNAIGSHEIAWRPHE